MNNKIRKIFAIIIGFLFCVFKEVAVDLITSREYLKHEYNRDGESFRSPWSNKFFPEAADAEFFPSAELLKLEQKFNDVFSQYVYLYYDSAMSSVYLVDSETPGFNGSFLVKKVLENQKEIKYGCWDSIHIVTCEIGAETIKYQLVSTVLLTVEAEQEALGKMTIAGSSSKTANSEAPVNADFAQNADMVHIRYIGKLIEHNEGLLRDEVADQYLTKQRQITNSGRLMEEYMTKEEKSKF